MIEINLKQQKKEGQISSRQEITYKLSLYVFYCFWSFLKFFTVFFVLFCFKINLFVAFSGLYTNFVWFYAFS